MKIAVISANLGAYDPPREWVAQRVPAGVTVDVHRLTDETFPTRAKAMTPALQCGIPKWFGPDFFYADCYLWVDASCALLDEDCVSRWLAALGDREMVLFQHPDRQTVQQEYDFIKARLATPGERYLTKRYTGEWLDEEYAAIVADPAFVDDRLYASTAFMYRPTRRVKQMMAAVFAAKARWHLHDQLYLAYAVQAHRCYVNVIPERYTECEYLTYVRNWQRGRRRAS